MATILKTQEECCWNLNRTVRTVIPTVLVFQRLSDE